jgi:hypothetical protein
LAGLLFVLPKVGKLKMVDIKGPTPATEVQYKHSVELSAEELRRMLARFTPQSAPHPTSAQTQAPAETGQPQAPPQDAPSAHLRPTTDGPRQQRDPRHPLPNRDLDTGRVVKPGGYSLTDSTFATLLHLLTRQPAVPIPPGIKEEIQAYYSNPDASISTKKDPKQWAEVQADLETLAKMPTSMEPTPYPTYGDDAASTK